MTPWRLTTAIPQVSKQSRGQVVRMISWLSGIMSLLVMEYMHPAIPFCCLPQVTLSCPFSRLKVYLS